MTFSFYKFFYDISPSIDARNMILVSFDASRQGNSNELSLAFLRSLDGKIFTFSSFFEFRSFEKFEGFETSFESDLIWIQSD